jgi:cellulose synthase/poly-beta-1,6-N-acetylglucosamine synthase-like glycosyltransferase
MRQIVLKYFSVITILFWVLAFLIVQDSFIRLLVIFPAFFLIVSALIKWMGIKSFNIKKHNDLYFKYRGSNSSVDIFLPVAGEDIETLKKTWSGVKSIDYSNFKVHVLDDGRSEQVEKLAKLYGFNYVTRDNNHFKKAGNLKNAFLKTTGDYILILDADFVPKKQIIKSLLPYMLEDGKIGIVQSPQVFDYKNKKGLEQGAGNIQNFFYSVVQPARDSFGGAICVGTNALYSRSALEEVGGNYLIEYSEDVWTGFSLLRLGYKIKYIPVELAVGECPSDSYSFFKQQSRWCQGSTSLVSSLYFWKSKISFMQRLSYISGFSFYLYSFLILTFPLITVYTLAFGNNINNSFFITYILPFYIITSMLHTWIFIYKDSNINTIIAHCLSSWSYSFALFNKLILRRNEEWMPTGSAKKQKSISYNITKTLIYLYTFFLTIILAFAALYLESKIFIVYLCLNWIVHIITSIFLIKEHR